MSDREVVRAPVTERVHRSVLRHTLLVASAFLLAVPAAYVTSTRMHVTYTAEGKLWAKNADRQLWRDGIVGPLGLMWPERPNVWIRLLRSPAVLDPAVLDARLTVRSPVNDAVVRPRDAAFVLSHSLMVEPGDDGHVIRVALEGTDPRETAGVVNAVMEHGVAVAGKLQLARLKEQLRILEEQLERSKLELQQAERDLEAFRVGTTNASSHRVSRPDEGQITEARLRRQVQVVESVYSDLGRRVESVKLAAASSAPELRILDRASVPDRPSRSERLPTAALILLACLALVAGVGARGLLHVARDARPYS